MVDNQNEYVNSKRQKDVVYRERTLKPKKPRLHRDQPAKTTREVTGEYHSAANVKEAIRLLAIDGYSFIDCKRIMHERGSPVSALSISNLRSEAIAMVKLMEKLGLINADKLMRRRKKANQEDPV